MKGWKWAIVILLLLALSVSAYVWRKYSGTKSAQNKLLSLAPKVMMAGMEIKDIEPETIKMDCKMQIANPLPVNLSADSLHYQVWVDSVMIMKDTYRKSINIRKKDSTSIVLPLEVKSATLKNLIQKFERQKTDSAKYTVKTNFKMDVPVIGKHEFNLDMSKRLPAIRKITASMGKIRVDKLGFKDSKLAMSVIIDNHNSFPIDISNGKYGVTVEKDLELEGALQKNVHIPAKGQQEVSMNMDVKTAKVPKLGWKMLFHKKQTHFSVRFTGELRSDISLLDKTRLQMHTEGTLEDIKELAQAK